VDATLKTGDRQSQAETTAALAAGTGPRHKDPSMNEASDFLLTLAEQAGQAILSVYNTDFSVRHKSDQSPLTLADTRSHAIIAAALRERFPDIPILSEEGRAVAYSERCRWTRFWLVDPLDGTKEFVKRNGEFTVNIALIEERRPVLGVIHVPVTGVSYLGEVGRGCWELENGRRRPLHLEADPGRRPLRVVCSRSHASPQLEELLARLPVHDRVARGSSLKFCAVAGGEADFYPRLGPTSEWDTGAGQAIVRAAGGVVVDPTGNPFTYNKEDIINGPFLVAPSLAWLRRLGLV